MSTTQEMPHPRLLPWGYRTEAQAREDIARSRARRAAHLFACKAHALQERCGKVVSLAAYKARMG